MLKRIVPYSCILTLTIFIFSCNKIERIRIPVSFYFNPVEDNILPPSYLAVFLNYPNDLSKLGLYGKVRKIIYNNENQYEITFDTLGNIVQYTSIIPNINHVDIDSFSYNYNEHLQLINISKRSNLLEKEKIREGKTFAYVDFFDFTAHHKPLYAKFYKPDGKKAKQDHLGQYHYTEKGVCESMDVVKSNPDKDKLKKIFCNITSDENGLPTLIQVQDIDLIGRHAGERTIYPKYTSGNLASTLEKSIVPNTSIDSILSESIYAYNSKGDIETWRYSESTYPQNSFTEYQLKFSYKYDEQNNWIEKRITGQYDHLDAIINNASITNYEIRKEPNEGVGVGTLILKRLIEYYETN